MRALKLACQFQGTSARLAMTYFDVPLGRSSIAKIDEKNSFMPGPNVLTNGVIAANAST